MVEQAVKHVRRFAGGRGDDLGVVRAELVGDMGVEGDAGIVAMPRIDVRERFALPAGAKAAPPPPTRERAW